MADMLDIIKATALDAIEASSPTQLYYGMVLTTDPFAVQLEEFLNLGEDFLVLSSSVEQKIFTDEIVVGSKVLLIREQGGQSFWVMDLIPGNDWEATDLSGEDGVSPLSLQLKSSTYVVAFDTDGNLKDTSDITLGAIQQNFDNEIIWETTPEITLTGEDFVRSFSPTVFETHDSITVKIYSNGITDQVTIVKVSDGNTANDGYTIVLSNETHGFSGSESTATAGSTSCEVYAYKGTELVPVLIGTAENVPLGMNVDIQNNDTTYASFTVEVSEGMDTLSGVLDIPITVDAIAFVKNFSYTVVLNGEKGVGISSVVEQYYLSTSKSDVTGGEWSSEIPSWQSDTYIWTRSKITYTNGDAEYTLACVNSMWEESIAYIDIQYYMSSSSEVLEGGTWSSEAPTWENGKYMWMQTVSYNGKDEVIATSNPSCIAGAKGDSGQGVVSVLNQYYLSTSNEEMIGDEWSYSLPVWTYRTYLWVRTVITYENPSITTYSEAYVDSSWDALNGIVIGGINLIRGTSDEYEIYETGQYQQSFYQKSLSDLGVSVGDVLCYSVYLKPNTDSVSAKACILNCISDDAYNENFGNIIEADSEGYSYVVFEITDETVEKGLFFGVYNGDESSETGSKGLYKKVKVENGNVRTDWSLAPDDILENAVTDATDELLPFIQVNETTINQTNEDIEFLRTTINGQIDDVGNIVSANKAEIEEYIRFSGAEITLGRSDSSFAAVLDNTELKFTENDEKVAYISNQKLNIKDANIEKDLQVQNFMWTQRENGNFSLVFVG
ncbi:MAG: DUF2577 family protein [Clostridia bacterium]